jgi:hypothetical protein
MDENYCSVARFTANHFLVVKYSAVVILSIVFPFFQPCFK